MKQATILLVVLFCSLPVSAQQPAPGFPMYGSFDSQGIASVNLQNLNYHMAIPVVSSPGRKLPLNFGLSYDSSIWKVLGGSWTPRTDASGNANWGWTTNNVVGRLQFAVSHAHCPGDPVGLNLGSTFYSNFSFVTQNGTAHPSSVSYRVAGDNCGTSSGSTTGYATDNSGFFLDGAQVAVWDRSGVRSSGNNTLEDTNGNRITGAPNTSNPAEYDWTDSVGRLSLKSVTSNGLTDFYYLDSSGNYQLVEITYSTFNIKTNFGCSGVVEYTGSVSLPLYIKLPNLQKYTFNYEQTPGASGYYTGRISSILLPTGGSLVFSYTGSNGGISCTDATTTGLQITANTGPPASIKKFSRAPSGSNWQTTITYPQLLYDTVSNQTVVTFNSSGQETSRQIYQGSVVPASLLRTNNTTWAANATPSTQTLILEDGQTQSQTETSFDSYGNLLFTKEHDWGTGTPGNVLRTTTITYSADANYTSRHILNLVTDKTVADSGGTVRSRQHFAYDTNTLSPCPTGVVGHDDSGYPCTFTYRGNLSSITSYKTASTSSGPVTKNFYFDVFGNLVKADLNCCQSKTWTFSSATQYAYPDSITSGAVGSTQLTTGTTYNFSSSTVATSTDENGQVTSYTYDKMNRLLTGKRPDNTQITYTYDDANNAVSVSAPIQGTNALQKKSVYDGLGRTIKTTALDASNNPYSISEVQYDVSSRPYRVSNPHNSTAQFWTETDFDALERPTVVIPPDGSASSNNTKYAYATNTVNVTDPAGKAIKRQVDGLGRITRVFEPDTANGNALTQETDLSYSATDSLLQVTQGVQTRNYTYDDLGRLLTAKTPETNQVASNYVHNDFDLLTQRTDPRGVITTYSYDSLNRLGQVSYNVGTTGVPATPTLTFTYDEGGAASYALGRPTTLTDGTGTEKYSYDILGEMTQLKKTVNGTQYIVGYAYNLAGELASITYPSGRVVQESFDAIGRPCAVGAGGATCTTGTNYASGLAYNPSGQVTGLSYGNGVTAAISYSSDRLQLQTLSYAKGAQTLASLSYWYKTDSTNCPSAPAGNNGQIQCISDNVDSGRSVAYSYDALYRLTNATTSGSTAYPKWGLSFGYDRYGNRLNQSIASGCVAPMTCPTNSVTADSTTNRISGSPYAYDANGNMTNDGQNILTYDAEDHAVSAAGTAYVYDGNGLRVWKCAPNCTTPASSTIYIFSGSKVIAEYDTGAAVGAPSREYVYAGSAPLAKFESGATTYFHPDHLSNRLLTDSSGSTLGQRGHYPYGETWYESGTTTKLKFTSYERDSETGNDFAMARYNVSRLGRFNAPDRIAGSSLTPQSLNRYSYVQNDPVNAADPSGMLIVPGFYGGYGGAVDASGFSGLWGEFSLQGLVSTTITQTLTTNLIDYSCDGGACTGIVQYSLSISTTLNQGPLLAGGGASQTIKDIINNALKQSKLSECLNKWIGPGTVLTNGNLPYLNGTMSSAQLSALRGADHVLGTPDMPVPSTGRGTALVASDTLGNMDLAVRVYLHETANILAMQQFTNSGVAGNDRALLGARGSPPTGIQAWEAAHPPADGDIGWQFELCVFGARGGTTVVVH